MINNEIIECYLNCKYKAYQILMEFFSISEIVEWPFGNLKQNLGLREFLTRRIENVKVEHNLVCTAHNLKVMWVKFEEKVSILEKIVSLPANFPPKIYYFFEFCLKICQKRLLTRLNC